MHIASERERSPLARWFRTGYDGGRSGMRPRPPAPARVRRPMPSADPVVPIAIDDMRTYGRREIMSARPAGAALQRGQRRDAAIGRDADLRLFLRSGGNFGWRFGCRRLRPLKLASAGRRPSGAPGAAAHSGAALRREALRLWVVFSIAGRQRVFQPAPAEPSGIGFGSAQRHPQARPPIDCRRRSRASSGAPHNATSGPRAAPAPTRHARR